MATEGQLRRIRQAREAASRRPRTIEEFSARSAKAAKFSEFRRQQAFFDEEQRKTEMTESALESVTNILPNFFRLVADGYSSAPDKFIENTKEAAKDYQEGRWVRGTLKGGLRNAGDAAITLFTPFTAAIGAVLQGLGGQKLVDKAGEVIADKSGITDWERFQQFAMEHPNAGEDFERALMLSMSGAVKGDINPKRMQAEAKKLIDHVKNPTPPPVRLPVRSAPESKIPIKRDFSQRFTPDSKLPEIEFGGKARPRGKLPTIEFGDVGPRDYATTRIKVGEFVYEPIGGVKAPQISPVRKATAPKVPSPGAPTPRVQPLEISATAEKIVAEARRLGLEADIAGIPKVKQITLINESAKAIEFMKNEPAKAKRVALGQEPAPAGIISQRVFIEMKKKAFAEMDTSLINELSRTTVGTEAGQALVSLRDSFFEIDPVRIIRDLRKNRQDAVQKKLGSKTTVAKETSKIKKEINKEIAKENKKTTWESFVKSIQC